MAFMTIREGCTWEEAYEEAKLQGIILTHKKNPSGAYFCYANPYLQKHSKKQRKNETKKIHHGPTGKQPR